MFFEDDPSYVNDFTGGVSVGNGNWGGSFTWGDSGVPVYGRGGYYGGSYGAGGYYGNRYGQGVFGGDFVWILLVLLIAAYAIWGR